MGLIKKCKKNKNWKKRIRKMNNYDEEPFKRWRIFWKGKILRWNFLNGWKLATFTTLSLNHALTVIVYQWCTVSGKEITGAAIAKIFSKIQCSSRLKIGEMKRYHGLQRAKYWGLPKMNIQATISAIVVNFKRFVTLNSCGYRWGS